jgi:hypothetical protein
MRSCNFFLGSILFLVLLFGPPGVVVSIVRCDGAMVMPVTMVMPLTMVMPVTKVMPVTLVSNSAQKSNDNVNEL